MDDSERATCWLFHRWSRWTFEEEEDRQRRMCLGCGKLQTRSMGLRPKTHEHRWRIIKSQDMGHPSKFDKDKFVTTGTVHTLQCETCGDVMKRQVNIGE